MPEIFVLDTKPNPRRWDQILPSGARRCSVSGSTISPRPQPGDVLVFHEDSGASGAVWMLASTGVLVVAINEGGGAGKEQPSGFYSRRRGVGRPTDNHFRVCFAQFWQRLEETNTLDWQLLEGPPPPDALLAYHLLDLLRGDDAADRAREALADAAREEAQTIAAVEGIQPLAAIGDPVQRREFLRRCS